MSEGVSCDQGRNSEFGKIIKDFIKDILTTFPEKAQTLDENLRRVVCDEDEDTKGIDELKQYCTEVYPERFFDILYQNVDIFKDKEINTKFLPGLEFKELWSCELTDKTRETIWKYLQLILFSIIGNVSKGDTFGDTAKLFEAINEEEFKSKLEETIGQMENLFDTSEGGTNEDPGINLENLPDPDEIHSHITGMLDGKLGKLAREIAEETANEFNQDMGGASTVNDVFQKLFKNPGRLMGLVKNVGTKLDSKIKSGEIKESELMEEAGNLMKKMKDMPGLENMLGKLGGGGKGGRLNMGAMQSHMQQNIRQAKMKERLRAKAEAKRAEQEKVAQQEATLTQTKDGKIVFSTGETVEKSQRKKRRKRNKKKAKK